MNVKHRALLVLMQQVNKEASIQKNLYRVSIVIENVPGYFPTGGNDTEPWYWDEKTCIQQNLKLGFNEDSLTEIITSSMFPKIIIKSEVIK